MHRDEFLLYYVTFGDIAQLIRVLPWHGRSRGFESLYLHHDGLTRNTDRKKIGQSEWVGHSTKGSLRLAGALLFVASEECDLAVLLHRSITACPRGSSDLIEQWRLLVTNDFRLIEVEALKEGLVDVTARSILSVPI
jgi:hypothetical protein